MAVMPRVDASPLDLKKFSRRAPFSICSPLNTIWCAGRGGRHGSRLEHELSELLQLLNPPPRPSARLPALHAPAPASPQSGGGQSGRP